MNSEQKTKRLELKKSFAHHDKDGGSSEVQVALLTQQIQILSDHMRANRKDFSSFRGMMRKINNRKKHLRYLMVNKPESYLKVISELGLRK